MTDHGDLVNLADLTDQQLPNSADLINVEDVAVVVDLDQEEGDDE